MFSSRTPDDLAPNPLARAIAARRAAGDVLLDLTVSNPTTVGLEYPFEAIDEAFARAGGGVYRPDPRGAASARTAVARRFAERGATVAIDDVFLTASTSEAYALLLTLLCDPGDEVLVGAPGYPLFEHLVAQHGGVVRRYAVQATVDALVAAVSDRTRAVIVVSPNNPSGDVWSAAQLAELAQVLAQRDVALICDEVFCDYGYAGGPTPSVAECDAGLVFALDGLSKSCAMPQLKLAWLVCAGDASLRRRAIARLEHLADTRLSVSAHVQRALPDLFELGVPLREQIHRRLARNRAVVTDALANIRGARLSPARAGWYGVLELPAGHRDEDTARALLDHGFIVQPGYFYDYDRDDVVVVSLLTPEAQLRRGVDALVGVVGR